MRKHKSVESDVIADSSVYPFFIPLESKAFNTAQRGCCSTQTGISQARIIIVQLSPCKRIRIASCQESIQVFFMRDFLDTKVTQKIIIQPPANVIMTAEIILKYIIPWQLGNKIKLTAQKRNISCGNGMPGCCHGCYIIKKMTFWLFNSSKIRNHLFRRHDNFSKKKHTRAYDFADHTHNTDNGVYLRKISAVCSQLLPDIGNCVKTYNINPLVGKIKHIKDHFVKNYWISVIQIPLIGIKGSHNMFPDIIQPGKVSRRRGREYLRTGFFI